MVRRRVRVSPLLPHASSSDRVKGSPTSRVVSDWIVERHIRNPQPQTVIEIKAGFACRRRILWFQNELF